MGTPDASIPTLAAGAGHGEAGDAPQQGPAQQPIEALAAQPKPANADKTANAEKSGARSARAQRPGKAETAIADAPVIELAGASKPEAAQAATRGNGLVMTRPKPEKRKNAKERAKAKFAKGSDNDEAKDGTRPTTATAKSEAKSKAKSAAKAAGKAERKAKRAAAKAA